MPVYDYTIKEFIKALTNLRGILRKAEQYAEEKKVDTNFLLRDRLYPDMFDFSMQVRTACSNAADFAAQASGKEAPKFEKKEEAIEELRVRMDATLVFLQSIAPADIEGMLDKKMTLYFLPGKYLTGCDFITEYLHPNFYFHVTTAYAILRKNGVPIGKADYIGAFTLHDL